MSEPIFLLGKSRHRSHDAQSIDPGCSSELKRCAKNFELKQAVELDLPAIGQRPLKEQFDHSGLSLSQHRHSVYPCAERNGVVRDTS
jgi:hypothetical protein